MSFPIQPDSPFNLNPPTGTNLPQANHLLTQALKATLETQNAELQKLPSDTKQKKIASMLKQHEDQLYDVLDKTSSTTNLPEKVKQQFVLGKIAQQKQFLEQLQTSSKSTKTGSSNIFHSYGSTISSSGGSNPPASEKTLDIDGVSVYEWHAPNGSTLYIPVGHSTAGTNDNTPSEAWGYAMRNAVEAGDKTFFQQLSQSYLYFCNQSIGSTGIFGLMGWDPNMTTGSYSGTSDASSASDADEDIINSLIAGYQKFGDMTITDPVTPPGTPNTHTSISLHDLALTACESFIKGNGQGNGDIGSVIVV